MDFLVLLLYLSLEVKDLLYDEFFISLSVCMGRIHVSFRFMFVLGELHIYYDEDDSVGLWVCK